MKVKVFIIATVLVGSLSAQADAADQLKCQITNTYALSGTGLLVEIQKNVDTYYKYNKIGANFYVDTIRGVVMGDLSNIVHDKVTVLNTRDQNREGLTVLMAKLGATNYLWVNTITDPDEKNPNPIKPFYWVDGQFIYTGTCR